MVFYLPKKPTKWGFKLHILAASESGYRYNIYFDKGILSYLIYLFIKFFEK